MTFDTKKLMWTREPEQYRITPEQIEITTRPHTDLWQRTYYHFRNDNAPVLQMETDEPYFSFEVKTDFARSQHRFDQCGIALYLDSENWLSLSEDGRTFTYSVHFDSANVLLQGTPEEYAFHQMGTYVYTTDLYTGDTRYKIVTAGMEGLPGTLAEQQAYDDTINSLIDGDYGRVVLNR